MLLHVSVPVLSDSIKDTYPSSSFKDDYYTLAYIPLFGQIKSASHSINIACKNLTHSVVTKRDIGIKFVNNNIH
jgi:hypothetical protein